MRCLFLSLACNILQRSNSIITEEINSFQRDGDLFVISQNEELHPLPPFQGKGLWVEMGVWWWGGLLTEPAGSHWAKNNAYVLLTR